MKVGILSMQRIDNYGSLLQSYALKTMIESFGHEVGFLDIRKGDTSKSHLVSAKSPAITGEGVSKPNYRFKLKEKLFTDRSFSSFRFGALGMTASECTDGSLFDAVVIGSDEVFNYSPACSWGFSDQLFGATGSKKTISYAASCGYSRSEDVFEDHRGALVNALQSLSAVSVRDENTNKFVSGLGREDAVINLDPVLVYDFSSELARVKKKYPDNILLVYGYTNRFRDQSEIAAIKEYAATNGLVTVCVGGWQWWCDKYLCPGPFEVLSLFRDARAVVTDTFHGTIMAAKFNKPLAVFLRPSNVNKLGDLIQRVHIDAVQVRAASELSGVLAAAPDYSAFNAEIALQSKVTRDYLARNLGVSA